MNHLELTHQRIAACQMLIDYVHDDIPHARQQPLMDYLLDLRSNFELDLLSLKEEQAALQ